MAALYELTAQMRQIEDVIEALEESGADDAEATSALYDALIQTDGEIAEKLERYARIVRNEEGYAAMIKNEAQALAAKAKVRENRATRLKTAVKLALETLGIGKQEAGPFTWSVQANGGKAPLDVDPTLDISKIDPRFVRTIPEQKVLDTDAVRAALEAGEELEFAVVRERGTHVRLK